MKPNLFKFATKELSQDAFLAWLLQWASPQCREHNPALNAVATEFVNRLISLQGTAPPEITRIEVELQWEKIDVCAEINYSHLIIIEDKVGTDAHSDQLSRYYNIAKDWCQEHGRELIAVYIKTHSDCSSNFARIAEEGFAVFGRRELLEFLNAHEVASDIYNDFRDRLREIETAESLFRVVPIAEWSWDAWKGFYQAVEQARPLKEWNYVPNQSGGFLNAILNNSQCQGYPFYMQIEQDRLCFKVGEVYEDRREVRERFHHLLMENATPDMGVERPYPFGSGLYMTVGIVPRSVWLGKDDEILDFETVIARLNKYEAWLLQIIESVETSAGIPVSTDSHDPGT